MMNYYNYEMEMYKDVMQAIRDNYTAEEIRQNLKERDEWAEKLNDELWVDDSVTGNASGSYWFSFAKAEQALAGNWSLLADALCEFGCEDVNILRKGAEYCDVTIRCYLLSSVIADALDRLEELEEEAEA